MHIRHGAGFDWTPGLVSTDVEEDVRIETDTLRGEICRKIQQSSVGSPNMTMMADAS